MNNFLHRLLNPHCQHCLAEKIQEQTAKRLERDFEREEVREESICTSCETLARQLEIKNHECEVLLARLLEKPAIPVSTGPPQITRNPRMIPFSVRRQMLEAEDRHKAELLRNAPKPATTADLEKEVLTDEATENV